MEEKEEKLIDQTDLAQDVSDKIPYEFFDKYLVKPLDPIKVKKEFSTPASNKPATKDEDGVEAVDYDEVKTEIKEVDSDYRKAVVLKTPLRNYTDGTSAGDINIGDIVIFKDRSSEFFDLVKDSRLVTYYNIVAVER